MQIQGIKKTSLFGYGLLAVTILAAGVYVLLFTATGFSWILNKNIIDAGTEISVSSVHHKLNGTSELTGLSYDSPSIHIEFSNLELNWNLLTILNKEIHIKSFRADKVSLSTSGDHSLDKMSPDAKLPFAITIEQGFIHQLNLAFSLKSVDYHTSVRQVKMEQVFLYDNFYANQVVFTNSSGGSFKVSGKAGLREGDVINLTTRATFTIPGTTNVLSSHGTIVGTRDKLNYLQNIHAPYNVKLSGSVTDVLSRPYWNFLISDVDEIDRALLNERWNISEIQGSVRGEGFTDELQYSMQLSVKDSESKTWKISGKSLLKNGASDFQLSAQNTETNDPAMLSITGTWQHNSDSKFPRNVRFSGNAENLIWPVINKDRILLDQGSFDFDGITLGANIRVSGLKVESTGTHLKELRINSKAADDLRIALSGKAVTNDGSISFSGELKKFVQEYRVDQLTISGENFALLRQPKAHIIISPDIKLTRVNQTIQSIGSIKIPTANIQLTGIEDSYNHLTNLIFRKSSTKGNAANQTINRLNVELGKSVWLHGYGLNANVTGDLSLTNLTRNQLSASGKLNVVQGNYNKQNERFSVSGGTLSFDNKHLDNPQLDLKVVLKNRDRSKSTVIQGRLQSLYGAHEKASNSSNNDRSGRNISPVAFNTH